MPLISIVAPMYNEEDVLDVFFRRVKNVLLELTEDFEIICVNDGSRDATLLRLKAHRAADARIKIVDLSRNFGKETALSAGLDYATGNAVIPIDADLQDPPEVIPALVEKWRAGADVVLAVRDDRSSDTFLKRATAGAFYWMFAHLSKPAIPKNVGDFRLMDRKVVDALKQLPERSRFMKGLFAWVGFETDDVRYTRDARAAGETKFNYWKLWNFALDGVISFSSLPLRIWSYLGFLVSLGAIGFMAFTIIRTLIFGVDVPGYASLMTVMLFFNGAMMIGIGVIGEYLARIFTEVKGRPLYLVAKAEGFEAAPAAEPVRQAAS
ncbi:MAG: glycosyltransferase family 2 protein [Pseudomonadota bacterium]